MQIYPDVPDATLFKIKKFFKRLKAKRKYIVRRSVGHFHRGEIAKAHTEDEKKTLAASMTAQMKVENDHILARLNWVLQANGFLFAAYGLALNSAAKNNQMMVPNLPRPNDNIIDSAAQAVTTFNNTLISFQFVVSFTGAMLALLSGLGITGAYKSINNLKGKWIRNFGTNSCYGCPFSPPEPSFRGRVPPLSITFFLFWLWFFLCVSVLLYHQ